MSFGHSIHPSETAGDGKIIEQSRYIKKTDKVDRRINCAQCGFPVDLETRATGADSYDLPEPVSSTETIDPPGPGISQSDTFAEPVDDRGAGCPLCRSMNPQGVNRAKPFGSGINLEGL